MNRFAIASPKTFKEAAELLADKRFTLPVLKAGGMDVLDHLKEGLYEPDVLINIKRLKLESGPAVNVGANSIRIEAGATLAEIASSKMIQEQAGVLAQAADSAATPQVRNVATAAGNLLQRPRCWYYRNVEFNCLKKGGDRCYSVEGENKFHAIFGDGPCHIVHPSNLAPALMVCEGVVHVTGGTRKSLPIASLFHMPSKGVGDEHTLDKGEVVTHITLSPAAKSGFYVVKEKQSFDWPLVLACVALEMDGDTIKAARVCAGAVAPTPWKLPNVADALKGIKVTDDAALRNAAALSIQGARPMSGNAYKLKLLPVAVRRRAEGRGHSFGAQGMSESRPIKLTASCLHLRNKAMYSDGQQDVRGMVDESIDTIPFFCTQTCDCLGPDNEPASPQDCKPGRKCYTKAE